MANQSSDKRRSLFAQAAPKAPRTRLQFQSLEDRAVPATLLVTNDLDTLTAGTLRQAIADSNASVGVLDTINFDPAFFTTDKVITLGSQLAVTDAVQIVNPAGPSQVTIEGVSTTSFGIFTSTANLTLDGVTVTKGGSISRGGVATLTTTGAAFTAKNSILTGNAGSRGGVLDVPYASTATQVFENSTLSNNTGPTGAIYYFGGGALLVKNSTLSGNVGTGTAGFHGGAIIFYGATTAAGITIENSTIHGNTSASTAGGGGINFNSVDTTAGPIVIRNSTITGNITGTGATGGGGIGSTAGAPAITLVSSIVAQNTGPTASPDVLITNGTLTGSFSLLGVLPTTNFTDGGSNLSGTQATPLNPLLTNLQNNGGPTFTRLPQVGSPVLNVGSNPAALATDQRGLARAFPAVADMGAAERNPADAAPSANSTPANIVDGGGTSHTFTVTYEDTDGGTIGINASTIDSSDIQVTGPGGYNVTATLVGVNVTGNGSPRIATYSIPAAGGTWDPADNGTYTLSMLANAVRDLDNVPVLAGTLATFTVDAPVLAIVTTDADTGPGSLRDAIATINSDTFAGQIIFDPGFFNTAKTISLDTALPAFSATGGRVDLVGPGANLLTIERSATASGGNFRILTTLALQTEISGVKLTNGFADTLNGGAILSGTAGAFLSVADSIITGNQATGDAFNAGSGGGIAIFSNSALKLQNTAISGNTATRSGGGVYVYFNGNLLLENSSITGNTATGGSAALSGGGGVYFYGVVNAAPAGFTPGTVTIRNSTIANNISGRAGGGIEVFNLGGNLSLQNSTITGNQSTDSVGTYYTYSGGGIAALGGAPTVILDNTVVSGNIGTTAPDLHDPVALLNFVATSSLIGDPTGATITDGGGNLPNGTDPQLGSLVSLGVTDGFVPATTSPLLNAGNNGLIATGVTTDQVGGTHDRVFGAAVDIGAFEVQPPKVSVEQAVGQVDPTNGTSIVFDIVFNMPVADFDISDITLTSAVGGTVTSLTGSGTTYQATVTGMTGEGVMSLDVAAGVATDVSTLGNAASTSVDNDVTFDNVAPSSVVTQFAGQNDPTNTGPVAFDVQFSEDVTGFDASDISTSSSSVGGTLVPVVTQITPSHYKVEVLGMTGNGSVVISYANGAATDAIGNLSVAPTLTDNTVTFDTTAPTVTVNQAVGQADPSGGVSVTFTATFSEDVIGLTAGDFDLTGTTAPGATVTSVTGGPLVYTITVGNMTAGGTVVVALPANTVTDLAGNNNVASTFTDNSVIFVKSGTVQFNSATYTISEQGSPQLTIDVTRTGGSEGPLSVDYATIAGGSATVGSDYTTTSGTLTWTAGDTANKTFNIPILDDSDVEVSETINLALSTISLTGALGTPSTAVATITDFEEGDITFDAASYTVSEAGTATITVKRLDGGDGAVDVTYAMTLGTAEASDLGTPNILPGTLSWADGDTADKVITIPIINDILSEGFETVNFAVSVPTNGALLGANPTAVLTINPSDGIKIDALTKFKALNFLDTDGDKVSVGLGGKTGSLEVFKTDDNGPISLIVLTGTNPLKSSVKVSVKKGASGNGFTNIGAITGTGVKSISATKSIIDGPGINLAGYLGSAKLAGIANGADIITTGTNLQKTSISVAGAIGDGTLIQTGSILNSLSALSFGDSDIVAPSAGKITVKGAFSGDITLSGLGVDHLKKKTLASLSATGTVNNADLNVTGNIGALATKVDWTNSTINGYSLAKMTVSGNLTNTDITLSGISVNHLKSAKSLGTLTVKKVTSDSDISVVGNVGAVTTYGFVNSRLFGGYTGPDNGVGGTFNPTIKTTIGSFKSLANAKAGLTGLFDNSSIIAEKLTAATLAAVDEANGTDEFGIFVNDSFKTVSITDTKQKFAGIAFSDQDFSIKIV